MNNPIETIADNWRRTVDQVQQATGACGRRPGCVQIVGVTKYVDARLTRALVEAGCGQLGESRPQALWDKAAELADLPCQWHMIGHLQRNKVRRTVPLVSLIHSVDSLSLAQAIARIGGELGREPQVLVEVNVSGDNAKHGVSPDAVLGMLEDLGGLEHLQVVGLMAMAGLDSGPDEARRQFAAVRRLRDELSARGLPPSIHLEHLSMGMSDDFPLAIAEGATIVRIGSRLFA